jgi:hypothetical protein
LKKPKWPVGRTRWKGTQALARMPCWAPGYQMTAPGCQPCERAVLEAGSQFLVKAPQLMPHTAG